MNLQQRIDLLVRLGQYMSGKEEQWLGVKHRAFTGNNWFIPEFIDLSVKNITERFLQPELLHRLAEQYAVPAEQPAPKRIGIVLAGNIPLVGFHDVLCTFLTGHYALIKPSSKDEVLIEHLIKKLVEWDAAAATYLETSFLLKGCDAYIATGSNNTGRYFEHYFKSYPTIIRKNRTSVAVLTGEETGEELELLSDDIHQFFGLGCRNVTQLFVPQGYDFIPLLKAFDKYAYFINHHKYKNNYDYNLAIHILNNHYYMTNGTTLLVQTESPFSPISQVHYQYYTNVDEVAQKLQGNEAIQCVVGKSGIYFGQAQCPQITDYADGVDTMAFLKNSS
jgi:hypothetical protein